MRHQRFNGVSFGEEMPNTIVLGASNEDLKSFEMLFLQRPPLDLNCRNLFLKLYAQILLWVAHWEYFVYSGGARWKKITKLKIFPRKSRTRPSLGSFNANESINRLSTGWYRWTAMGQGVQIQTMDNRHEEKYGSLWSKTWTDWRWIEGDHDKMFTFLLDFDCI